MQKEEDEEEEEEEDEEEEEEEEDNRLAGKMSQWLKVLATNPEDLSPIPRPHIEEGQNQFLKPVL